MDNRGKFEAWFRRSTAPANKFGYVKEELWWSWQACAEQKDKEIAELKDIINKVWADTYPGAVPADTIFALKMRVKNLAEDRACWVFNAKVLQNKLNSLGEK